MSRITKELSVCLIIIFIKSYSDNNSLFEISLFCLKNMRTILQVANYIYQERFLYCLFRNLKENKEDLGNNYF